MGQNKGMKKYGGAEEDAKWLMHAVRSLSRVACWEKPCAKLGPALGWLRLVSLWGPLQSHWAIIGHLIIPSMVQKAVHITSNLICAAAFGGGAFIITILWMKQNYLREVK